MSATDETYGYLVGTDIGGTFTDCVVIDEAGAITTAKAPSTPDDRSRGFFDAIGAAAAQLDLELDALLRRSRLLVHATTAGTNALVERRGAAVGLLTTRGHGEMLSFMRGARRTKGLPLAEVLRFDRATAAEPLLPPESIREVTERVDSLGEVVVELDEDEVRESIRSLLDGGAEAIAISFIWGFINPTHETRAREIVLEEAPDAFVSCSHRVAPQVGEYPRTVATVVNSYLGPLMANYTGRIAGATKGHDLSVLFSQCIGGAASHSKIQALPLLTLDSGPVGGIGACVHLAQRLGSPNVITADMGGTTFDVSLIADGEAHRRDHKLVDRYEMALPMVDVESIGAGGGSIAWIDPATATMKVGPRSAGADPGPIAFGRGGSEPTVTDANVVLGILDPDNFLGGSYSLDADAARAGIAALGEQLGLGPEQTAAGIRSIIDMAMAEKIRRLTVQRGHDPRDFEIFAFGGGGPLHAGAFSRELGVRRVVIPLGDTASVLSAFGTVAADITAVHVQDVRLEAPFDVADLDRGFARLEGLAREDLEEQGFAGDLVDLRRVVDMKYGAQVYDIEVPVEDGDDSERMVDRFQENYERRFGAGSGYAPAGIFVIRQRVYSAGKLPRPKLDGLGAGGGIVPVIGSRRVWFPERGEWVDTPTVSGIGRAQVGYQVEGPAIVDLPDTTVPVRFGETLRVDEQRNLVLEFPSSEGD